MTADPFAPCSRPPGHPGRCRNPAGTTWEGHCDATDQQANPPAQPNLFGDAA